MRDRKGVDRSDNYDRELSAAWDAFCEKLKDAGKIPFRENAPTTAVDRAAGFQQIARNISLALAFNYEFKDPLFPELSRYFDPTRKQGGDNSDCCYVGAQVNGTDTYRVVGHRGTARYFSVTAVDEGNTPWGGRAAHALYGPEIETNPDGTFELIVSPHPHSGNWLRTTPNTFRITFRQYFADWENEVPMTARIDRLTDDDVPAPMLSPEKLMAGLADAGQWIHDAINYWPAMLEQWKAQPNIFLSYWQLEKHAIDAAPGGDPLVCYWQLPKDEALIVRVRPADCPYWSVEFGNYWWETMDYRYRLSNTNCHYAQLEDDGELIVVIAHDDPGVPNWLDCSGFSEGYVTYRWMLSQQHPLPQAQQVKFTNLFEHLPRNVKRIGTQQRHEQLAARRRGVANRFGY